MLSEEVTLSKLYLHPSEKGPTLKGKKMLLLGANPFLLEQAPFHMGFDVQKGKQEDTRVVSLGRNGRKIYQVYPILLSYLQTYKNPSTAYCDGHGQSRPNKQHMIRLHGCPADPCNLVFCHKGFIKF